MQQGHSFVPQLVTALKEGYSRKTFLQDLTAGVIVGIVALPLAIAFAIASGVKPEQGLYTAIIGGFLISALGGSRFQIGGPTGAFIVIVYGIVVQYGYEGLAVATLIAGLLLIVMGFLKIGSFIKFIPYPVTVGFTTGIALIIFTSQVRDFLGLAIPKVPAEFIEKLGAYGEHIRTINPWATGVGLVSLVIMLSWPRKWAKIPGSLVAIIATTLAVQLFKLPVDTIAMRYGGVPSSLPAPHLPMISWDLVRQVLSPAVAIALLSAIEALLSAVVADGMTGRRHRSNIELVAQGVASIGSVLFGGIPATGAIARTATNIKNGAQTPVAGMIHAAILPIIMIFFGKWAGLIPLSTLAAILFVVAYNMSEMHLFTKLLRSTNSDSVLLLVTFFLTVLLDLTVAIQVGVVLAAFLFMFRMSKATRTSYITQSLQDEEETDDPEAANKREIPEGVEVFEVYGAFFFGVVDAFKSSVQLFEKKPKVFILHLRHVMAIDASGLKALEELHEKMKHDGTVLLLSGVDATLLRSLKPVGLVQKIGERYISSHIDEALCSAREILQAPKASLPQPSLLGVEVESTREHVESVLRRPRGFPHAPVAPPIQPASSRVGPDGSTDERHKAEQTNPVPPSSLALREEEHTLPNPDEVLRRLLEGNARFTSNLGTASRRADASLRERLSSGQRPAAVVLTCSDSRVAPELVFDQSLGEIFVVRVAGHAVNPMVLGSIEYAVEELNASLIVVLGHERCGAVAAAAEGGEKGSGNLGSLVTAIAPAVAWAEKAAIGREKVEVIDLAVTENVRLTVDNLKLSPTLARLAQEGVLKIVGARYCLDDGRVTVLDDPADGGGARDRIAETG